MLNGLDHFTVGLPKTALPGAPQIHGHTESIRKVPSGKDVAPSPAQAGPSDIDRLLTEGFWLRFPPTLELRFLSAQAERRAKIFIASGMLVIILFNWFLLSDWFMVPDVFDEALKLRLFSFTPCAIGGLYLTIKLASPSQREWLTMLVGLLASTVNLYVCLSSGDAMAGPYLIGLLPVVIFSNTVAQMRFYPALLMDCVVLAMFGYGAWALSEQSSLAIIIPAGLTLTSATVFTLYGCYILERDERQNWLMRMRERLLTHELQRANKHLDEVSRCDILTDVANRRHFDAHLQQVWERAQRDGSEISLLMIDVDHFKSYNDRHGHPEGDECLKAVAAMLKRRLRRPGDLVARFGGEEFIAVLSGAPLSTAASAAERVRKGVENLNIPHGGSSAHTLVTISIGVACLRPNAPHATAAQLISAADEALYQAKSRGRNRVFAFGTTG